MSANSLIEFGGDLEFKKHYGSGYSSSTYHQKTKHYYTKGETIWNIILIVATFYFIYGTINAMISLDIKGIVIFCILDFLAMILLAASGID